MLCVVQCVLCVCMCLCTGPDCSGSARVSRLEVWDLRTAKRHVLLPDAPRRCSGMVLSELRIARFTDQRDPDLTRTLLYSLDTGDLIAEHEGEVYCRTTAVCGVRGMAQRNVLWFIGTESWTIHYYDLDYPRTGVHELRFDDYTLHCVRRNVAIFRSERVSGEFLLYALDEGYGALTSLRASSDVREALAHSYAFFLQVNEAKAEQAELCVFAVIRDAPQTLPPPLVPHAPTQSFPRVSARLLCTILGAPPLTPLLPSDNSHGPVFQDPKSSKLWRIV